MEQNLTAIGLQPGRLSTHLRWQWRSRRSENEGYPDLLKWLFQSQTLVPGEKHREQRLGRWLSCLCTTNTTSHVKSMNSDREIEQSLNPSFILTLKWNSHTLFLPLFVIASKHTVTAVWVGFFSVGYMQKTCSKCSFFCRLLSATAKIVGKTKSTVMTLLFYLFHLQLSAQWAHLHDVIRGTGGKKNAEMEQKKR